MKSNHFKWAVTGKKKKRPVCGLFRRVLFFLNVLFIFHALHVLIPDLKPSTVFRKWSLTCATLCSWWISWLIISPAAALWVKVTFWTESKTWTSAARSFLFYTNYYGSYYPCFLRDVCVSVWQVRGRLAQVTFWNWGTRKVVWHYRGWDWTSSFKTKQFMFKFVFCLWL